jgi:GH25 family lysozyme M1 (1,4-beta-N-acetylmuramidase)
MKPVPDRTLAAPTSPTAARTSRRRPVSSGRPGLPRRKGTSTWRRVLIALLSVTAASLGAVPGAAAAERAPTLDRGPELAATTGILEGIDVSQWQGTINWPNVAAAGKAFAIIKATEGRTFNDPNYLVNHTGAQAAGLWTGTYHFASPDTTAGDAILEADHFVSVARLGIGDLIPALDLEVSGGLGIPALQAWVTAWLGEVTKKIGIRPMIYTSPAFWKKYMGDSDALANAGYTVLWIAHWGVLSPTIPANNWGGHGWTFWQYTSDGSVSGISGRVDLDRFNGTDLQAQAYSIFKLTATGATTKQGRSTTASIGIIRTNFPSEVALNVTGLPAGATATFVTSPTTEATAAMNVATDAASTPTGTYPLTITAVGNGLTKTVKASLVVIDGNPPTVGAPSTTLFAGSTMGSSAVPVRVAWSASDPSGISSTGLQRSISGGSWVGVQLASTAAVTCYESIGFGVTAQQRARATDRFANTSSWSVGSLVTARLTQQSAATVIYGGTWHSQSKTWASGGSLRYSTAAGASATYKFVGSSVAWISARGPDRGSARVYLDGVYVATVKLYASTYHSKAIAFASHWGGNGSHTVRIVVVGTAGHPRVDVDAFVALSLS